MAYALYCCHGASLALAYRVLKWINRTYESLPKIKGLQASYDLVIFPNSVLVRDQSGFPKENRAYHDMFAVRE